MQWGFDSKKFLSFGAAFAFVLIGTYNAVVINSESTISADEVKFIKRIDEVYGVVTPGRMVAASTSWKKLKAEEVRQNPIVQVVNRLDSAPAVSAPEEKTESVAQAAVQEDLSLNLVEVVNPKKYPQGLQLAQFSGSLSTSGGTIETLSVSLPNGDGVSVSFSEMSGNVFEYDLDGELYSGMMYQVDPSSYMVTLSNGPLEGTRLRFTKSADEAQNDGGFVETPVQEVTEAQAPVENPLPVEELQPLQTYQTEELSQYDQNVQLQAQSYNLEQPAL